MGKKVFLSHSSKDHKTAEAICGALESRGHSCWMSSRDVKPGENFQGAIVRAIREAGVMVLVFSSNANNSDEIKKEMALASQSRMMVIPVRAEDVLPSEDFTYELATRQWIDMFKDWEQAIEKLSRQIDVAIPPDSGGLKSVIRPRGDGSTSSLPLLAGLAILLLASGAAAFWLMRPAPHEVSPPQRVNPQASAMEAAKLERDLWDSVKNSGNAAAINSYLMKYPAGTFSAAAKARLAELNKATPIKVARVQPSFSCAGATKVAEKIICGNGELAALDAEIASLYRKARENAVDTAPLADEESAWLLRRDRCASVECIRVSYAQRRAEISRWLTGGEQ